MSNFHSNGPRSASIMTTDNNATMVNVYIEPTVDRTLLILGPGGLGNATALMDTQDAGGKSSRIIARGDTFVICNHDNTREILKVRLDESNNTLINGISLSDLKAEADQLSIDIQRLQAGGGGGGGDGNTLDQLAKVAGLIVKIAGMFGG